jgi:CheY-like chemotaxis protein
MVCCKYRNDLSTRTSESYHNDNFNRTFDSFDPRHYDEIITKVNLQTREEFKRNTIRYMDNQKTQGEGLLHNQSSKKKVLVVDDEPDVCMVYQIVLEDAGFECFSYMDPVKALREFRPSYYDLILLDIKMPVLNGFELSGKIREVDKAVHIIFITASEAYYEKFRSQHFPELRKINYIQKPIGNEELVQIVNMIIANSVTID